MKVLKSSGRMCIRFPIRGNVHNIVALDHHGK